MKLLKYIGKRLLWGVLVLAFVSFFSFLVIQLPPGDYITVYIAQLEAKGMSMDENTMLALRNSYGFDQPFLVQYGKWAFKFIQGDMGVSFLYTDKVATIIYQRLPMTLLISFTSLVLIYLISIPVGIYSARNQYSVGDFGFAFLGFIGMAVPGFLLALIFMWIAYEGFGVSIGGLQSPYYMDQPMSWAKFIDLLKHLPVPVLVISLSGTAALIRTMRASLLDELNSQYVTTARAKGLEESKLIHKYPVTAALNPVISSGGWLLPQLFSGSTVASIVLGLPTVGPLLYRALLGQDMYLAAGCIMILSGLIIIGLLISDVILALTDPRIRLS
ncbi:MAG: ABC transporter permease [Cyclobacteriaceae bacterium]